MPFRATQGFTTRHAGRRVRYGRGDIVPAEVAKGRDGLVERVSGAVEQATAAPGEVRETAHVCEDCGYTSKTRAGLGAHRRTHRDDG